MGTYNRRRVQATIAEQQIVLIPIRAIEATCRGAVRRVRMPLGVPVQEIDKGVGSSLPDLESLHAVLRIEKQWRGL